MSRCESCGDALIADGTEDRDWAVICEFCEFEMLCDSEAMELEAEL